MKSVLVLCTGNSCRSQIAHGYLNHFSNGIAEVVSAGVETHGVNPRAIKTMAADGIDISHHTSNNITEYEDRSFDYVITVCDNAKERCPFFPSNTKTLHQNFTDPAKATGSEAAIDAEFARVRDEIKAFTRDFAAEFLN